MATEIFIEPELEELSEATNSAEWKQICEKLELDGQKQIYSGTQPPPYTFIDPKTQRIIRTLCPMKTSLHTYRASTIPLDVLKEAQRCLDNDWYKGGLYVYYDDRSTDPFLVGKLNNEWNSDFHLIARWGNELLPMEELEIKAIARLREQAKNAVHRMNAEVKMILEDVDGFVSRMLLGESRPSFHFDVDNLR